MPSMDELRSGLVPSIVDAVVERGANIRIVPSCRTRLGDEEIVQRRTQNLDDAVAGFAAGVRVLAVDDVGPMTARDADLERPVVLAQRAGG